MIQDIKSQFPIFKHHPNLVYLDSAATTLKPRQVIDAERKYYEEYSANVERGLYPLSEQATEEYEAAREKVANFISAEKNEIVFTRGTTEAINFLSYTLEASLKSGDEIIITDMEHHSNFLPWQAVAKRTGAVLKVLPVASEEESQYPKLLESYITSQTKIFSFPFVSNVLGTIMPVAELIREAKNINPDIITIIDAAQAAAHVPIDVRALDCDFLAFSGHKCFGPTGIGVLYGKHERLATLPPFHYGGEMVAQASLEGSTWKEVPHKFEAGTPPIAQVIGLGAAIDFIKHIGLTNIRAHEQELLHYAQTKLRETFGSDITIFGPEDTSLRSGVIAFTLDGVHPHDIAHVLGEAQICIRAGAHCAQPLHDTLGTPATARLSVSVYNSTKDIDALLSKLQDAQKLFRKHQTIL